MQELDEELAKLRAELKQFEAMDPEFVALLGAWRWRGRGDAGPDAEGEKAKEASNRWTDNIFTIQVGRV